MNDSFVSLTNDKRLPFRREFPPAPGLSRRWRLVVVLLGLCLLLACREFAPRAERMQDIVAGELSLSLPKRDERETFIRFTLEQTGAEGEIEVIASTGYQPVATIPVKFSLACSRQAFLDGGAISLITRLAADIDGIEEVTSMISPVRRDSLGSYLYLAIELPPEPIAQIIE